MVLTASKPVTGYWMQSRIKTAQCELFVSSSRTARSINARRENAMPIENITEHIHIIPVALSSKKTKNVSPKLPYFHFLIFRQIVNVMTGQIKKLNPTIADLAASCSSQRNIALISNEVNTMYTTTIMVIFFSLPNRCLLAKYQLLFARRVSMSAFHC